MHIMLALDGSRSSDTIVKWMKAFPHPSGTRLTLVHIIEPLDVPVTVDPQRYGVLPAARQRDAAERLDRIDQVLSKEYGAIQTIIREGFLTYELLTLLRDLRPDVVVCGTRRPRRTTGLTLGSVSQRLLTYVSCSVLLIPVNAAPMRRRRVMLATDGSRGARTATRFLTGLPGVQDVTAVSAIRPAGPRDLVAHGTESGQVRQVRALILRGRRGAAARALDDARKTLSSSGITVRGRTLTGVAAEAIVNIARREKPELLILGARGLTGMLATAMGSVSLTVAQTAPCPVLIVKKAL